MKTKTHFEQVPLAVVKKIIETEIPVPKHVGKTGRAASITRPVVATSWRAAFRMAQKESDTTRLSELVLAAEAMIFQRFQQLADSPNHGGERQDLSATADVLLRIKMERLGYPRLE